MCTVQCAQLCNGPNLKSIRLGSAAAASGVLQVALTMLPSDAFIVKCISKMHIAHADSVFSLWLRRMHTKQPTQNDINIVVI